MRTTLALIVALAFATPVAFVGCDRTVSESTRTTSGPGGTHQETKKVVTDRDTGTTVTQEKETVVNH
jgi:hypothetical protein